MSMSLPSPAKAGFTPLSPYVLSVLDEALPVNGRVTCESGGASLPSRKGFGALVKQAFKGKPASSYGYGDDTSKLVDPKLVTAIAAFKGAVVYPRSSEELLADPRIEKLIAVVKDVFENEVDRSGFSINDQLACFHAHFYPILDVSRKQLTPSQGCLFEIFLQHALVEVAVGRKAAEYQRLYKESGSIASFVSEKSELCELLALNALYHEPVAQGTFTEEIIENQFLRRQALPGKMAIRILLEAFGTPSSIRAEMNVCGKQIQELFRHAHLSLADFPLGEFDFSKLEKTCAKASLTADQRKQYQQLRRRIATLGEVYNCLCPEAPLAFNPKQKVVILLAEPTAMVAKSYYTVASWQAAGMPIGSSFIKNIAAMDRADCSNPEQAKAYSPVVAFVRFIDSVAGDLPLDQKAAFFNQAIERLWQSSSLDALDQKKRGEIDRALRVAFFDLLLEMVKPQNTVEEVAGLILHHPIDKMLKEQGDGILSDEMIDRFYPLCPHPALMLKRVQLQHLIQLRNAKTSAPSRSPMPSVVVAAVPAASTVAEAAREVVVELSENAKMLLALKDQSQSLKQRLEKAQTFFAGLKATSTFQSASFYKHLYEQAVQDGVQIADWDKQWAEYHTFDHLDRFVQVIERCISEKLV